MTTEAPKKRERKARRNFQRDLESLKAYVETKLEVLRELKADEPNDDQRDGQVAALEGVLRKMAQ